MNSFLIFQSNKPKTINPKEPHINPLGDNICRLTFGDLEIIKSLRFFNISKNEKLQKYLTND